MKNLFLKNGMELPVVLQESAGNAPQRKVRKIVLHNLSEELIAEIFQPDQNKIVVHGKFLKPYEVSAIAEISENFFFFWNNLYQ
jgi:hypothetical protein